LVLPLTGVTAVCPFKRFCGIAWAIVPKVDRPYDITRHVITVYILTFGVARQILWHYDLG
jgi:hypothetical protein